MKTQGALSTGSINRIEIGKPFSKKSVKTTLSRSHCDVRTQFSEHCSNIDVRSSERVIKISGVRWVIINHSWHGKSIMIGKTS